MNTRDTLQKIEDLLDNLKTTIKDNSNNNLLFVKEAIKQQAINIFNAALDLKIEDSLSEPPTNTEINAVEPIKEDAENTEPITEVKQVEIPKVEVSEVKIPVAEIPTPEEPKLSEIEIVENISTTKITEEPKIEEPISESVNELVNINKEETNLSKEKVSILDKHLIEEFDENDKSLNAKLAKNKVNKLNLADKMTLQPIADLNRAISISKKFEFINQLFNGNTESYKIAIATIEQQSSVENAMEYLQKQRNTKWDEKEELAEEFESLVKRRFL